eukprot:gnl/TRDRNA2_/TRDRNA2_192122_c0_seq1.p1 gnl/TRDRNA2_/TRDRNA2_192122_c0~~gnl/TRDRNA2_/TRDRNA2_192122_c0_seq1.p1  ORF type:complete len:343 (+),score=78.32 gnl/TRDRNA2_/TRDRNA2_192122_c0_seq1:53-1030(+)
MQSVLGFFGMASEDQQPPEDGECNTTTAQGDSSAEIQRVKVRQGVLITEQQRRELETEFAKAAWVVKPETCGSGQTGWETYYDNEAMALTMRGWWLRDSGGDWVLHVPVYEQVGEDQVQFENYEEITGLEEILEKVGLTKYAEAVRKGFGMTPERLFAQAGVVPIARLHTECRTFTGRMRAGDLFGCGASGAEAFGTPSDLEVELTVSFDELKFDAKYAEDARVSELLFTLGNGAMKAFRSMLASFELVVPAGDPEAARQARSDLRALLRSRGIDQQVSLRLACPRFLDYLRVCRPAHLRALRRANAVPPEGVEWGGAEEVVKST